MLKNPDLPIPGDLRAFWEQIEVEAFDEYTLQFRLLEPFAPFLDYLSFGILPAHLLEGIPPAELLNHPFNKAPVGSGPYQFERLLVENGVITGVALSAFDDYYEGRPFIDQIVFRYFPTSADAFMAYQQGEIQGVASIEPDVLPQALKEPNLDMYTGRLPQLCLILLNLDSAEAPYFGDASFRRALLMGLNRQWMVDRILDSQATLADGPIFPNTWAYYEDIPRIEYNPEEALEAIKAAGYTIPAEGGEVRSNEDGEFLSFSLVHPPDEPYPSLAQAIQKNWAALGIEVELEAVPYQELIENHLEPRSYDAALIDLDLFRSPDPDPYPFWHQTQTTGGQNYAMWDDRQASEYLEQARILVDPIERTRLYRNFQVRFVNEMPALPLFYPMYTYGVDAEIQNVQIGPIFDTPDRFATVTEWFLFSESAGGTVKEITPTADEE